MEAERILRFQVVKQVHAARKAIKASSTHNGVTETNRPVKMELARFKCLVTRKVLGSSGVGPKSATLFPVASDPMTTILPAYGVTRLVSPDLRRNWFEKIA